MMPLDIHELFTRCMARDRVALGQAMTFLESRRPADRVAAVTLLNWCEERVAGLAGSVKLAVSGAPGVGKSSLIEALGLMAVKAGHRVGVVTIDPSSRLSKGSILGDKSRMTTLSTSPDAFIRSSPAGDILGGMGRRTFELMALLEAAGFDLILLETVGVGQSEHLAWQFTDGFVLVLQPGAGDELQGIKRGITELADLVFVNKADGEMKKLAGMAKSHYLQALHYLSPARSDWQVRVLACSALTGECVNDAWQSIDDFCRFTLSHPERKIYRHRQHQNWLAWSVQCNAQELLLHHPAVQKRLTAAEKESSGDRIFKTEFEIGEIMRQLLADRPEN